MRSWVLGTLPVPRRDSNDIVEGSFNVLSICQQPRVIFHEEVACIYDRQGRQIQRITAGADMPSRAKKTQGITVRTVRNFMDVLSVFDSYTLSDKPHTCHGIAVSTVLLTNQGAPTIAKLHIC